MEPIGLSTGDAQRGVAFVVVGARFGEAAEVSPGFPLRVLEGVLF